MYFRKVIFFDIFHLSIHAYNFMLALCVSKEILMKRIIASVLCVFILISLISCGGEMPEKTPEPTTPEAQTPEAVTPEESYPKDVPCGYGSIMPWINEFDFEKNLPGIEIITDRDMLAKYREVYDQKIMSDLTQAEGSIIEAMLDYHEAAVKAFGLCDEDGFFEKNTLLLIAIPYQSVRKLTVNCQIAKDDSGVEKLMVDINCGSDFSAGFVEQVSYTFAVSIPNNIGIDSAEDIIVSW